MMRSQDNHFMHLALRLAERGLGQVWPNPAVGCVIVKDGRVIGRGWTQEGGRPHAETMALGQAGAGANGATCYVSLEPCSHEGKTPPCADALIQHKIKRVVIACSDPDPRVNGAGIAKLKAAGIEVIENVLSGQAQKLNEGFFLKTKENRPLIALKTATSLDGKVALANGTSQWITGEAARQYAHLLRSKYDAIVTGINTVLADDPQLNCRLPGLENHSPVRIVMDRDLRMTLTNRLVKTARDAPFWIYTQSKQQDKIARLEERGAKIFMLESVTPASCAAHMAGQGITRALIEAGQILTSSFLKSGLAEKIYWFRSPQIIGNDGMAAFGDLAHTKLEQTGKFSLGKTILLNSDICDVLLRPSL